MVVRIFNQGTVEFGKWETVCETDDRERAARIAKLYWEFGYEVQTEGDEPKISYDEMMAGGIDA